ncbi:hypothetical protein F0562_003375 [Nyssa sinensis]|uniref:Uncharacterized protein n=1 Tax=Nyssa sinensis TaxID=561372 RepID=A0A5J5BW84_9ASTE|nr:hypothetical protein F0562_003375 [Nyssa sinensis]
MVGRVGGSDGGGDGGDAVADGWWRKDGGYGGDGGRCSGGSVMKRWWRRGCGSVQRRAVWWWRCSRRGIRDCDVGEMRRRAVMEIMVIGAAVVLLGDGSDGYGGDGQVGGAVDGRRW